MSLHDKERVRLDAENAKLHACRAELKTRKADAQEADKAAALATLQRLTAEAGAPDPDDSPPDFSKPIPPPDPEALKRFEENKEREAREEREKQEARARDRDAADAHNHAAMEEQRKAGPDPEVIRRVEEARARATRGKAEADDVAPAATDRKRKGKKRKSGKDRRRKDAAPAAAAKPTVRELLAAVEQAETDEEVLAAVSRWCWAQTNSDTVCPQSRVASMESLTAELETIKKQEPEALQFRFAYLFVGYWAQHEILLLDSQPLLMAELAHPKEDGSFVAFSEPVTSVHKRWLKVRLDEPDLPHPLDTLIRTFQKLPLPAEWDMRQHVNMPAPLANTHYMAPARELRDGQTALPFDYAALQDGLAVPPDEPRFETGYLPFLELETSKLVPTALLSLWDNAGLGGASRGRGGPVPIPRRIGMEVLLAVPPDARINDSVRMVMRLDKLAALVWPRTVRLLPDETVVGYRRDRHGPLLIEALKVVSGPDYGTVAWSDGKSGARRVLVLVLDWPRSHEPGEPASFIVTLPPGSRQGPMVDKVVLRNLASASNGQHRMMLTAYCLWDRYGTINGRLVAPTLPVVHRDPAGYVVDARDNVVTEQGAPTRRATHKRAVKTGAREPNPEVNRYPWLMGRDLILTRHSTIGTTPVNRRKQRERVHADAKALRDSGHLDFEAGYQTQRGGGTDELVALRVLPPAAHLEAHAARWAARKHDRQ